MASTVLFFSALLECQLFPLLPFSPPAFYDEIGLSHRLSYSFLLNLKSSPPFSPGAKWLGFLPSMKNCRNMRYPLPPSSSHLDIARCSSFMAKKAFPAFLPMLNQVPSLIVVSSPDARKSVFLSHNARFLLSSLLFPS